MKRQLSVAGALAACLLVPLVGSAAGPPDVTLARRASHGTARDVMVPAGASCTVTGATIARDLVLVDNSSATVAGDEVGHDLRFGDESGADVSERPSPTTSSRRAWIPAPGSTRTTIVHDLLAAGDDSGFDTEGVSVGHDFVASGVESGADLAGTTVEHDVRLVGEGGDVHMERTTIGHDFFASRPQSVQTGHNGPDTPGGPVKVTAPSRSRARRGPTSSSCSTASATCTSGAT